jgi:hypothetical protein
MGWGGSGFGTKLTKTISTLMLFCTSVAWPQSQSQVTILMEWHRGDPYYGANFISLHLPCQNLQNGACECELNFKAIKSEEFANYISSFDTTRVPVTFDVVYGPESKLWGARLASVGKWSADRFPINDRFLGLKVYRPGDTSKKIKRREFHQPADCFPTTGTQPLEK